MDGPIPVSDVPAGGLADVALTETTALVLTNDGGALSVWQIPAGEPPEQIVAPDGLDDLEPSTVQIAAIPEGLIVTGMRCDEPMAGECVEHSGIVQLRNTDGTLVETRELWQHEPAQAGGSAPQFLGHESTSAWIDGLNDVVEIDESGEIVKRVPVVEGQSCMQDGVLYQVQVDMPVIDDDPDGVVSISPESMADAPPATIAMQRWDGSEWTNVDNGDLTDVGAAPEVRCQGGPFSVWNADDLEATWTAEAGWSETPEPSGPLHDTVDLSGQTGPGITDNGSVFRLYDDFRLLRLDIAAGELVDTGLVLEPTTANTESFIWLTVAESGPNVFACAGRADGMPDGPTEPGTVCGFAPVPA